AGERFVARARSDAQHLGGDVDFGRHSKYAPERPGSEADRREGIPVDLEPGAQGIRRRAEPVAPEFVTEHGDAIAIRHTVLILTKETAEPRRNSEYRKEVCRDNGAINLLRLVVGGHEQWGSGVVRGQALQRFGLIAEM